MLKMAAEWLRVGLERPHFLPLVRGQKTTGVAPAQSIRRAVKAFRWTGRGSSDAVFSRRAGTTSSFLLVFHNNRGRGEELFTPLLHGGFTNHFTGGAAPWLGKSMRYTLQKVPSCTHTGTMGGRERPHPLTHRASRALRGRSRPRGHFAPRRIARLRDATPRTCQTKCLTF
jgi:hypothetical protein